MHVETYGSELYVYAPQIKLWKVLTKNNKLGKIAPRAVQKALGVPTGPDTNKQTFEPALSTKLEKITDSGEGKKKKEAQKAASDMSIMQQLGYIFSPKEMLKDITGRGGKLSPKEDKKEKLGISAPEVATSESSGAGGMSLKVFDDIRKNTEMLIFEQKRTMKKIGSLHKPLKSIDFNIKTLVDDMIAQRRKKPFESLKKPLANAPGPAEEGGGPGIMDMLSGMGSGLLAMAARFWPFIKKMVKGFAKKIPIIGPIIALGFGLYDVAEDLMDGGDWKSAIGTLFESLFDSFTLGLGPAILGEGKIKNFTTNMLEKATDFFKDVVDAISNFFDDYIITPLVTIPKKMINALTTKIADVLDAIADFKIEIPIPDFLKKMFPSLASVTTFQPFSGLKSITASMRDSVAESEATMEQQSKNRAEKRSQRESARKEAVSTGPAAQVQDITSTATPTPTAAAPTPAPMSVGAAPTPTLTPTAPTPETKMAGEPAPATLVAPPKSGGIDTKAKEGFRAAAYQDVAGNTTIGYGHKLTPEELKSGKITLPDGTQIDWRNEKLTESQASSLMDKDKQSHSDQAFAALAKKGVDVNNLSPGVKSAIEDMSYNMGSGIFNKTPKLVDALKNNDLEGIKREMSDVGKTAGGVEYAGLNKRVGDRLALVQGDIDATRRSTGEAITSATASIAPEPATGSAPSITNVTNNTVAQNDSGRGGQRASTRSEDSSYRENTRKTAAYGVV